MPVSGPGKVKAVEGGADPAQAAAEANVRKAIAEDLGVQPGKVKVKMTTEATTWSDSTLGISEPGMGGAAVMTPGFRIAAQAKGNFYTYHTGSGGHARLASKVEAAVAKEISAQAVAAGAERFSVAPGAVKVLTMSSQYFPAPSFGFDRRDRTVFTVQVSVEGKTHQVNGEAGDLSVLGGRFGGGFGIDSFGGAASMGGAASLGGF